MRSPALGHEHRVGLLALGAGLPAVATALLLLATRSNFSPDVACLIGFSCVVSWLVLAFGTLRSVARPLENLSNILGSFRAGDFSVRARRSAGNSALAAATAELNALGDELRRQRLEAMEASALLAKVVENIDVVVFAFDNKAHLRLANDAGQRLLGVARERIIGRGAREIGLDELLNGDAPRSLEYPAGTTEWELRRCAFRLAGRAHTLVVLLPVERALRERERTAWQSLARVLGHEINNSLAPIRSIAQSSIDLVRAPRTSDIDQNLTRGLGVIISRADALARFTGSFAELARLPPPRLAPVAVASWIEQSVVAETRVAVTVDAGPALTVRGDADQLEHLLINLVQNAADAALETGGGVRVTWKVAGAQLEVRVIDDGPGILEPGNLFVPFFTTKPHGTGIGLVVARQIAEAHGGRLTLRSRDDASGCEARLVLPR